MGPEINTEAYEYTPMLSPEGDYLFLTRYADGNGDIFWVNAKILDQLRVGSGIS